MNRLALAASASPEAKPQTNISAKSRLSFACPTETRILAQVGIRTLADSFRILREWADRSRITIKSGGAEGMRARLF